LDHIESHNKIVILVDDGAATGLTMVASIRYLKSSGKCQQIIVATPIGPKGNIVLLKSENIDHIEVINTPENAGFKSVEQYYQDFPQVTDKEVIDSLAKSD
jgi:putative phosphoribosyl transferase